MEKELSSRRTKNKENIFWREQQRQKVESCTCPFTAPCQRTCWWHLIGLPPGPRQSVGLDFLRRIITLWIIPNILQPGCLLLYVQPFYSANLVPSAGWRWSLAFWLSFAVTFCLPINRWNKNTNNTLHHSISNIFRNVCHIRLYWSFLMAWKALIKIT